MFSHILRTGHWSQVHTLLGRDLELSVKFKAVEGSIDRAAGMVFRLVDPDNFCIVRANALEDNYRLYHVIKGRRQQFAGANFKVEPGKWHELRVECAGNKITIRPK